MGVYAAIFLAALLVVQWLLVVWWCRITRERLQENEARADREFAVTVVLCLRGRDPSLSDCLVALANQNYPSYSVLCVVDSNSDAAVSALEELPAELATRFQLIVASPPTGRCSLKCNSLVAALDRIGQSGDVIVLVDADGVPDKDWLRDLVRPLADDDVVVSSGCRWFIPMDDRYGTMVRWLWNLAGSVQLVLYRIPWGGSVAIRREFASSVALRDVWSKSLFDDTQLYALAKKAGKRTVVLPELLIPCRESTSLSAAYRWMQRQLLNVRLYHPAYGLAALHCLTTNIALAAVVVWGIAGWWTNDSRVTGLCGIAILLWIAFYAWCLRAIDGTARVAIESRFGKVPGYKPSVTAVISSVALTQGAYFLAVCSSSLQRRVRWRGVQYRFRGPYNVQIESIKTPTSMTATRDGDPVRDSIEN